MSSKDWRGLVEEIYQSWKNGDVVVEQMEKARAWLYHEYVRAPVPGVLPPETCMGSQEGGACGHPRHNPETGRHDLPPVVKETWDWGGSLVYDLSSEAQLVNEILDELKRARAKFPGDNVTTLALVEEVGELAKATFEESAARVRKEAIQVATMAMRVVLDGDSTLDAWRAQKGLDPLGAK